MSPAAVGTSMYALEWTASLFAWEQSSHAKLRAIVAHESGASRVHFGSSFNTSARLDGGAARWNYQHAHIEKRHNMSAAINVDLPVVASTFSPTCASVAKRPILMKLCTALPRTKTSLILMSTISPLSVEWDDHIASILGRGRAIGCDDQRGDRAQATFHC
eukprot:6175955-Pleurochrysis_carterae.AAC.3